MADTANEISALEARLVAALSRIEVGLAKMPSPADAAEAAGVAEAPPALDLPLAEAEDADELERLRTELEEERTANAQLERRVRQIKRKQEGRVSALEEKLELTQKQLDAAEKQTAKMRRANEDMRGALEDLQTSAAEAAPDAHLINRAMMAELEALRAERATDAAEIDQLILALEPLVTGDAKNA